MQTLYLNMTHSEVDVLRIADTLLSVHLETVHAYMLLDIAVMIYLRIEPLNDKNVKNTKCYQDLASGQNFRYNTFRKLF